MRPKYLRIPVLLFCLAASAPALANDDKVETDEGIEAQSFVTFDHHGYFRFRGDLFLNGHLGNAQLAANPRLLTSGFLPPIHQLDVNAQHGEDSDVVMGANIRMRWQPEMKIGGSLTLKTTLDVLDNVVLGSTPDFHADRPDTPLVFLSDSQTDFTDAIRVKEVYAEWDILAFLLLKVGRMGDQFGLGMVSNNGACPDCDFGDYVDRVALRIAAFGFNSWWFFDAPGDGQSTLNSLQPFGQPTDMASVDDVIRWGFTLGYTPIGKEEQAARKKELGTGKAVFDVVFKNTFTTQTLDSTLPALPETGPCSGTDPLEPDFDCQTLRKRDYDTWVGDLWFRMLWHPNFETRFRAELEFAAVFGSAGAVQSSQEAGDSAKDFVGFGGVLQLDLQHRKLTYGLEVGFATGDDVAFGVFGPGFTNPSDSVYAQDPALRTNNDVTSFTFDRDYHVDLIMYREVIGAVTNSLYVKPSIEALLFSSGEDVIGGRLSAIYGHALQPSSTPGKEAPLGIETDISIFYEATGVARAELEAGVLVPLDAFRAGLGGPKPEVAFSLQARITMSF